MFLKLLPEDTKKWGKMLKKSAKKVVKIAYLHDNKKSFHPQ